MLRLLLLTEVTLIFPTSETHKITSNNILVIYEKIDLMDLTRSGVKGTLEISILPTATMGRKTLWA